MWFPPAPLYRLLCNVVEAVGALVSLAVLMLFTGLELSEAERVLEFLSIGLGAVTKDGIVVAGISGRGSSADSVKVGEPENVDSAAIDTSLSWKESGPRCCRCCIN
jgi:hypothetical protein